MQVRVQPTGGTSNLHSAAQQRRDRFRPDQRRRRQTAYKGIGNFKRANPNLRLIAIAFPLTLGILVPKDSPIKTIADLKGKRMPSGYNAQTTGRVLQEAVLATEGLKHEGHHRRADAEPVLRHRSARRRQGRGGYHCGRRRAGAAGQRQPWLARRRPLPQHEVDARGDGCDPQDPARAAVPYAAGAACGSASSSRRRSWLTTSSSPPTTRCPTTSSTIVVKMHA